MPDETKSLAGLLRRRSVVEALLEGRHPETADIAVTNPAGRVLLGNPGLSRQPSIPLRRGVHEFARVHGARRDEVARTLSLLLEQDAEFRSLARDSLARYRELTTLYDLSEKMIGAQGPQQIGSLICDQAGMLLAPDGVSLMVLNPDAGRLETLAVSGRALQSRATRALGDDLVAEVLRSGAGRIVNDLAGDPRGLDAEGAPGSAICCPLKTSESVVGVLVVTSDAPREFSAGDLKTVESLASQAAAALEVARLDRSLKGVSRKPATVIYGVDERPPPVVTLVFAFQQVMIALLSLAYPVLITLEAGGTRIEAQQVVSCSLIAMAAGTLLQSVRIGPVGSGLLAPSITSAIFLGPSLLAARAGGLELVFGMTVFAGLVALALSQVLGRIRKLFPPEVSGLVVLMVGLSIVQVGLSRLLGIGDAATSDPQPHAGLIGVITLAIIVALSVLRIEKLRIYSTAIGLGAGYLLCWWFGLLDPGLLAEVDRLPLVGMVSSPVTGLGFDAALAVPFVVAARLCCTNPVRDSSRESSMVAGLHEQTSTPDLQDQELAGL